MSTVTIDLDLPPQPIELGRISIKIADIWKRVGLELGLQPYQLNTIELNHPNHNENASLDMLLKWSDANKNATRRTLNQVIELCQNIGGMYLFCNHTHLC